MTDKQCSLYLRAEWHLRLKLFFLYRASMLKQLASWRSSSKSRKFTSELLQRSLRAPANSSARSATSSPFTTWRRKTLTRPSTCSKSQRSSAKITNSDRLWLSTTWPATIVELEKWELLSTFCSGPSRLRADCSDPRSRLTLIWTSAPCFLSWTSTNWPWTTQWVPLFCSKKWCLPRD